MNTLDNLYQQVLSDDALKASFAEAAKDRDALAAWLKAQDCEATPEDVQAFIQAKANKTGELDDDELDAASGGCNPREMLGSMFTLGLACITWTIVSAAKGKVGGEGGDNEQLLCY